MPTIHDIAAAWVNADIAMGDLAPEKRDERIAQRVNRFAIVVTRDTRGTERSQYIAIGLAYGSGTNADAFWRSAEAVDGWGDYVAVSPVHLIDDTAVFIRENVDALRDQFGSLPIRANRFAMPAAIAAGVILAGD